MRRPEYMVAYLICAHWFWWMVIVRESNQQIIRRMRIYVKNTKSEIPENQLTK